MGFCELLCTRIIVNAFELFNRQIYGWNLSRSFTKLIIFLRIFILFMILSLRRVQCEIEQCDKYEDDDLYTFIGSKWEETSGIMS